MKLIMGAVLLMGGPAVIGKGHEVFGLLCVFIGGMLVALHVREWGKKGGRR